MRLELSWAKPPVSWMFFKSPGEQRCASTAPTRYRELCWVQPGIAHSSQEGETKAGAQGLEARGFARSTMGMGLCCPLALRITPSYSCTSQTDDKSSAPGISEAFGWVLPSHRGRNAGGTGADHLVTRTTEGLWSPTRLSRTLLISSMFFSHPSERSF